MPEHVHLLLSEPQQDMLADALKSLKQGVSRRLIGDYPLKPKTGLNGPTVGLIKNMPHLWIFRLRRQNTSIQRSTLLN
jgi:REP element-mobilizing transposase RayT